MTCQNNLDRKKIGWKILNLMVPQISKVPCYLRKHLKLFLKIPTSSARRLIAKHLNWHRLLKTQSAGTLLKLIQNMSLSRPSSKNRLSETDAHSTKLPIANYTKRHFQSRNSSWDTHTTLYKYLPSRQDLLNWIFTAVIKRATLPSMNTIFLLPLRSRSVELWTKQPV